MKKIYLCFFSSLLVFFNSFAIADNTDKKDEFLQKVISSETATLSLTKATTEELTDTLASLDTDVNLQKFDDFYGYVNMYLANDTNSLYMVPSLKLNMPLFPNHVKVEIGEFEGLTNTAVNLNTNLSNEALGFAGSNSHEVHLKASVFNLMLEVLGGGDMPNYDDDASDTSTVLNYIKKTLINTKSYNSSEEELESFFSSLTDSDDYDLTLGKRTDYDLNKAKNELADNDNYHEVQLDNSGRNKASVTVAAYMSNDLNSAHIFLDNINGTYQGYVKVEKNDTDGDSVNAAFYTNLPHEDLNFVGSSNTKVNITFNLRAVLSSMGMPGILSK